jgi:hypothetical protein
MGNKNIKQPHKPRLGRLKNGNQPCDLSQLPRCTAIAKHSRKPCQQPAMANGKCYWHGGKSTGAPLGNQNALKYGIYTKEALAKRRELRELLAECKSLQKQVG